MNQLGEKLLRFVHKPCPYCGLQMLNGDDLRRYPTRDHAIPRAAGQQFFPGPPGLGGRSNIIIVCRECNADKGAASLHHWLLKLLLDEDPRAVFVERTMKLLPQIVQRRMNDLAHAEKAYAKLEKLRAKLQAGRQDSQSAG